jgi:uncharacterized protein (TIGR03083 family)
MTESGTAPWISALRHSHERLRANVEPLGPGRLTQLSYCSGWSIAEVVSHIGSQSEIFELWLDAGLSGREPPGRDVFAPIWDKWNAKSPQAQAADGLAADLAALERFGSLDAGQLARLRLQLFGMDLDAAGLARMRLSEHAIHTWDVAVALDPEATVSPDAVALLIDMAGRFMARAAKPDGKQRTVRVLTSGPDREFILETGEAVTLAPAGDQAPEPGSAELRLPAEAFIRLVYGRLDPAHTPPAQATGVDLDELRQMFPGV